MPTRLPLKSNLIAPNSQLTKLAIGMDRPEKALSALARYTRDRAARDPEFAENLESGYTDFKIGALLRQAREKVGLTQEEVAIRLETKTSAISRIENSAGDIRFSTLERYARAIGWQLDLELRPPRKRAAGRR
jgi:HTH-type transcriptional regulator/antitoxin HipB